MMGHAFTECSEERIYPKEKRPVRDLLRKRSYFVAQRTSNILSLQSMIDRCTGQRINSNIIKRFTEDEINRLFKEEHQRLNAKSSINMIRSLEQEIKTIEKAVLKKAKLKKELTRPERDHSGGEAPSGSI